MTQYVFKYTFKSPDFTAISVDELSAHLAGRLLSVSEAVHRLLSLPLHKEWPPVVRLHVHLPHEQNVVFDPTVDEQAIIAQLYSTTSTLMAWFQINSRDAFARTLLYHEMPEFYTWVAVANGGSWNRRIKSLMAVGRTFSVSPQNTELHSLRRLLSVVRGACSFQDLATVVRSQSSYHNPTDLTFHCCTLMYVYTFTRSQDGVIYETFRSALCARGLASDDSDIIATMFEIVGVETSLSSIRQHFARILVHNPPQDASRLFHMFAADMSDGDINDAAVMAATLWSIEDSMLSMGRSLAHADYGIELPVVDDGNAQRDGRRVRPRHMLPDYLSAAAATVECERLTAMFTAEQTAGYHLILESIHSNDPSSVFAVLASGGTGKTLFANGLAAAVRSRGSIAVCVAASALAAMLLTGGKTAHSEFHIPIPSNDTTMCCFTYAEKQLLRRADLIIWDECSMIHCDTADTVERSLRDVMQDQRPFGGKTVVFMGDFKQLLPVVRYGCGHKHTIQQCAWWNQATRVSFSLNWRAVQNPDYAAELEAIGSGQVADVIVPETSCVADIDALIESVYGNVNSAPQGRQILALTLATCHDVNKLCLAKLHGDQHDKHAADIFVDCTDPDRCPREYVESLHLHGAPPFTLGLKIGARCGHMLSPSHIAFSHVYTFTRSHA
jgi:hypothetical protein